MLNKTNIFNMYSKIKVGSNKHLKRFCSVHKKTFNLMEKNYRFYV